MMPTIRAAGPTWASAVPSSTNWARRHRHRVEDLILYWEAQQVARCRMRSSEGSRYDSTSSRRLRLRDGRDVVAVHPVHSRRHNRDANSHVGRRPGRIETAGGLHQVAKMLDVHRMRALCASQMTKQRAGISWVISMPYLRPRDMAISSRADGSRRPQPLGVDGWQSQARR